MNNQMIFHVDGVRCHSCIQKIEKAFFNDRRIRHVEVQLAESILKISSEESITTKEIQNKLKSLGFLAHSIADKSEQINLQKKINQKKLKQIGIAGFCSGNIMLFSVSIYAGADGNYLKYFGWLSFVLFIPVVTYSSLDFYKSAWNSLKQKRFNIDLPISIALLSGFFLSIVNLINKDYEQLYFDSTASFIFLILSVRFFLLRLQQKIYRVSKKQLIDFEIQYGMADGTSKTVNEIKIGDKLILKKGQMLPVDAKLNSQHIEVNTVINSGESYPRVYQKDMVIPAGSMCLSENGEVEAITDYNDSSLSKLTKDLERIQNEKGLTSRLADKAAHYLLVIVFSISAIYFLLNFQTNFYETFQRVLALIIVACPCALALGTPLTYALGVRRATKFGMLLKDDAVFDDLLKIKNIIFDKTGTLTRGQLVVTKESAAEVNSDYVNIILNLEKNSIHPVAFALRAKWGSEFSELSVYDHKEIIGVGVSGVINSKLYELKKNQSLELISVVLYENSKPIITLDFEDQIREDAISLISKIKNNFKNIVLLSGDNSELVQLTARSCNISDENIYSNMTTHEKMEIVNKYNPCVMVGDGINDSLAISKAVVGISVTGAVSHSIENSRVYLLKDSLASIEHLFEVSKLVRRVLKSNLWISFGYNFIAGVMALTGLINPLVAAILMPLSSLVIIVNTYGRLK